MEELQLLISATVLIVCTVNDIRQRIIYNKILAPFALSGIIFCVITRDYFFILLAVFLLFFFFLFINGIGEGDRKLLSIMPLYLKENTPLFFFILSLVYLAVYHYQKRKKIQKLAFMPYILLAYTLSGIAAVLIF